MIPFSIDLRGEVVKVTKMAQLLRTELGILRKVDVHVGREIEMILQGE